MWYHKSKYKWKNKQNSPNFRHWFHKNPVFKFTPYIKIVSIYRPIDYVLKKQRLLHNKRKSNFSFVGKKNKEYIIFKRWIKYNQGLFSKISLPRKWYKWLKLKGWITYKRRNKFWNYSTQSWEFNKLPNKYKSKSIKLKKDSSLKQSKLLKKNELLKKKFNTLLMYKVKNFSYENLPYNNNKYIFKSKYLLYENSYLKWLINYITKFKTQKFKHYNFIKKKYYFDFSNYSKKILYLINIDKNNTIRNLGKGKRMDWVYRHKTQKIGQKHFFNDLYNKYLQINKLNNHIILNRLSKRIFLKIRNFKSMSIIHRNLYNMEYNRLKAKKKKKGYLHYHLYKRLITYKNIKCNNFFLIKQFNDSFNLIYKFIYWYSTNTFNKYVSNFNIFNQKTKYYSYKESYICNFNRNYLYVQSILKCYKTLNIKDEYYKNSNQTKNHYIFFINRISKLSNFNYYYKRYASKFKIRTIEQSLFLKYNLGINKKLHKLKRLFLTSKNKYYSNTPVIDISFLYYDKINNNDYTDHLDDKYNFFIKKILHIKILNNLNKNNYLNQKKSIYSKTNKGNSFSISPLINNNKYKHIFSFLNIYHQVLNNKKTNYFYSFINIKLNVFILKNNLFTFFKDLFICKYKFYIYKKYFKRKAFIKKNLSWFEHRFVFDENNNLVTRYDYNKRLHLDLLYDIKYFFKNSYIDWFFYFNGNTSLKKKKFFFNTYKKSYNKFYKKKLFNIKFKKYFSYLIKKKILRNKETLIESFKEGLLEDNPYFDTDLNEKEINRWIKVYTIHFIRFLRVQFWRKPYLFELKKKYSFLKNNKSNKLIKDNIKSNNLYLQKYLNDYCSKIIKSNDLDNNYNTQYFQLNNKFLLYKKQIFNKSNLFVKKFWNFNLNNKNMSMSFTIDTINSLHKLKKIRSIKNYNMFILKYSTLKYFSFRDKYFNNLWLFNKRYNNSNKVLKKSTSFYNNNYNNFKNKNKLFSYFFHLRYFSKIYIYFFLQLKDLIFGHHLINSFSIYKNKILIYDLNKDDLNHKLKLIHIPNIFNFLDMDLSELLTNTNMKINI